MEERDENERNEREVESLLASSLELLLCIYRMQRLPNEIAIRRRVYSYVTYIFHSGEQLKVAVATTTLRDLSPCAVSRVTDFS